MEVIEQLQQIIDKYKQGGGSLIGVLQEVMQLYGYLPEDVLKEVARQIEVPYARFDSLATFYHSFRLEPIGKKHICVCVGTACHVRGAAKVVETLERELGIEAGQTSSDLQYTLDTVNCLGACALGPLVTVNGEYHGKMDQKKVARLVKQTQEQEQAQPEVEQAS